MAAITAALVKELRDKTGAGMMDSKKALTETDGDMEAAVDWLRAKGIAKADKKAGRTAAEGLVAAAVDGPVGALVEVNSETDFVARNAEFQEMVGEVAKVALEAGADVAALGEAAMPSSGKAVAAHIQDKVGTIGENMTLRRSARLSVGSGLVAHYVHAPVAPGLGKIGVLAAFETTADPSAVEEFAKKVCMHIASENPASMDVDDLDPDLVERERQVLTEQARESGKPEEVIEKMIAGRLNKFYQEVCLKRQEFVLDPDLTVAKAVAAEGKRLGAPLELTAFARLEVGEGIEKEESDFAAEVAAAVKS